MNYDDARSQVVEMYIKIELDQTIWLITDYIRRNKYIVPKLIAMTLSLTIGLQLVSYIIFNTDLTVAIISAALSSIISIGFQSKYYRRQSRKLKKAEWILQEVSDIYDRGFYSQTDLKYIKEKLEEFYDMN